MDQSPNLLDHLAMFNTSLAVVTAKRLYDLGILSVDDLEPARESLALMTAATTRAAEHEIGATFGLLIANLIETLPALASLPAEGCTN